MLDDILSVFVACAGWFGRILNTTGMQPVWLGGVAVWTVYRFLLKPLFGAAGSDRARRSASAGNSGVKSNGG